MTVNLSGVGAFGTGIGQGYDAATQRQQEIAFNRYRMQQAQAQQQAAAMQRQASGAYFNALTSPDMSALPQQGAPPPGFPPPQGGGRGGGPMMTPGQPMPPPGPPGGQGAGPQAMPPPSAPPGMPQQAAPVPGPRPPMGAGGGPMPQGGGQPMPPQQAPQPQGGGFQPGGFQMPDPIQRLGQMARTLKQANPGAPPDVLAMALEQQINAMKGLAPDDRAMMQAVLGQMRIESQQQIASMRDRTTQRGQDIHIEIAGQQSADKRYAVDRRIANLQSAAGQGKTFSPPQAKLFAEAWIAGDHTVTQGLGFGKTGAANRTAIMEQVASLADEYGLTGADLAAAKLAFGGDAAAARTAATTGARIDIGANEVKQYAQPLLDASKKVDRTRFPLLNSAQLSAMRASGDPDVVKFASQVQAMKNAYAQIAARGGQTTDDARRRSDEVLDKAWSQGQLEAGVQQLIVEAEAALKATEQTTNSVQERVRNRQPGGGRRPAGPMSTPAPDGGGGALPEGWSVEVH